MKGVFDLSEKRGNVALGMGFIFSAITIASLLVPYILLLAFFTYPISVILRIIGWLRMGRVMKFFGFVGSVMILLSPLYYLGYFIGGSIAPLLGITMWGLLTIMIVSWAIYSIFEALSYFYLAREGNKAFYGALISIPGIILVLYQYRIILSNDLMTALAYLYYALLFLIISSLLAAFGSFRLRV